MSAPVREEKSPGEEHSTGTAAKKLRLDPSAEARAAIKAQFQFDTIEIEIPPQEEEEDSEDSEDSEEENLKVGTTCSTDDNAGTDELEESQVLQSDHFGFLGEPKEFDVSVKLLWTIQTEKLWQSLLHDKAARGNVFGLIMAGPSGIGKSCIALMLALRCFAEGRLVLYVPDLGEMLLECYADCSVAIGGVCAVTQSALSASLLRALRKRILEANTDLIAAMDLPEPILWSKFREFLSEKSAVVIFDEHGHAYKEILKMNYDPRVVCPLMMPNGYQDLKLSKTRFVYAGSNQADFEAGLNGTYTYLINYINPLCPKDAPLFLGKCIEYGNTMTKHSAEENFDYANNVPREMIKMASYKSCVNYTAAALNRMTTALNEKVKRDSKELMDLLDSLFQAQSHGYVLENVSFLDLGFIYRMKNGEQVIGRPLCYPANLALLRLWLSLPGNDTSKARLALVKDNGDKFEDYVWRVLTARLFSDNHQIKCRNLGYDPKRTEEAVSLMQVKCNQYWVSSVTNPNNDGAMEYQREVGRLKKMANAMEISILYKCPTGGDSADFIIFKKDGVQIPIQVSISAFDHHNPPDMNFLGRGKAGTKKSLRLDFVDFLYITVKPGSHPVIAKSVKEGTSNKWPGCEKVRMVDAEEIFGI